MQYIKTRLPSASEEYHNLQEVCATSLLKRYKDRSEIILTNHVQIQIQN